MIIKFIFGASFLISGFEVVWVYSDIHLILQIINGIYIWHEILDEFYNVC